MPVNTLYSFAGAQVELSLRLGGRNDSSSGVSFSNRTAQWLNSAQMLMARATIAMPDLEQSATFNLNSGQNEYSFNSTIPPLTDIIGIEQIQIADTTQTPVLKQRLARFPFREYRALSMQATAQSTRWTRKGYIIAFDPIPDKAGYQILIDYRKQPVMNGVSIPAEFQEQWIKLAVYMAWSALGQNDKAQLTYRELPTTIRTALEQPLDDDQWDAMNDPELGIRPSNWGVGWRLSG